MLRLPIKSGTVVLVVLGIYASLFFYFRTGNTRIKFLKKLADSDQSQSVRVFADKRKPRQRSTTYIEPKYPAIDPERYGDLYHFPLKPIHIPGNTESMAEYKCADLFGARYTSYCDETSKLIARKLESKSSGSEGDGSGALGNSTSRSPLRRTRGNIKNGTAENLIRYKQDFLLEYCPCFPTTLIGRQKVSGKIREKSDSHSDATPNEPEPDREPVLPGGRWAPKDCRARQRVAVIIPFRDRHSHLEKLVTHLHPMLQRQQLDYTIFVIEQNKPTRIFNKGMLMNSGFMEIHGEKGIRRDNRPANPAFNTTLYSIFDDTEISAADKKLAEADKVAKNKKLKRSAKDSNATDTENKEDPMFTVEKDNSVTFGPKFWGNFDCYVFHDVDMLPEDDRNMYTCTKTPRHVGVYISKFNYTRCCGALFGGATAFTSQHFIAINGYSNEYYGWGGEDDDMIFRMKWQKMSWVSYPRCVSRYTMIRHERDERNWENPNRVIAVRSRPEVYRQVGLSSLTYDVVKTELRRLYTWILFDLPDSIQLPDGTIVPRFEKTKTGRIIRVT